MTFLFQGTDRNFDDEVLNSDSPVIVEFWAEWCKPCKMVSPVIEELARQYTGKTKFVQLNVAENHSVTSRLGIRNIPTLMFFQKGEVKQTIVGATARSRIEEELNRLLKVGIHD